MAVVIAAFVLGPLLYFFASPMVLYFAWIFLGSDLRALGGGLRTRQHFRRQLDIATSNPKDADAHYQLGLIYQERRQYDEARKRFLRAIEIDSREADPFFQLGKIAWEEGKAEEAIDFLSRAAALDDKCCSHEVWRELGRAYWKASRLEEACAPPRPNRRSPNVRGGRHDALAAPQTSGALGPDGLEQTPCDRLSGSLCHFDFFSSSHSSSRSAELFSIRSFASPFSTVMLSGLALSRLWLWPLSAV